MDVEMEDPLMHVEQSETMSAHGDEAGGDVRLPGFHLTEAGIRLTLNRGRRGKPLLELWCKGCSGSTFSADTYVPSDYLEWPPQYYKLTPRMWLGSCCDKVGLS